MIDLNTAMTQDQLQAFLQREDHGERRDRVRRAVNQRVEELVRMLLPAARIQGHEARIGSLAGEPGESISIELRGEKVGQWKEHNPGAPGELKGDLITLWMELEDRTFPEALDDLEEWCGIRQAPRWNTRIAKRGEVRAQEHAARPPEELEGRWNTVAIYTYRDAAGAPLAAVYRDEHTHQRGEDGKPKKKFKQQRPDGTWKGPEGLMPLYRQPEIRDEPYVVLVEGEKCADALAAMGIPATTAMGGCGADPAKTDWTPLTGKRVILWPDNDQGGLALPGKILPHLQRLGCAVEVVPIPPGKPAKWDAADAIEERESLGAILATAQPMSAPTVERFRFWTVDELLDIPPPEWRIDGIFTSHGTSVLFGAYETFKTFVALDMALSVAGGWDWHGRPVKRCPVVYVVGEGQYGFGPRVKGWLLSKGLAVPPNLYILPEAIALPAEGDLEALARRAELLPEMPGVFVFDTVTRMTGGGSLNEEKDVQSYVRGSDWLRARTGAHMMHIGHTGKQGRERGLLGSIVLPAAAETIIAIERLKGANRVTLHNHHDEGGKQKDGAPFDPITLELRRFAFEHRGHELTTLVPELSEDMVEGVGPEGFKEARREAQRQLTDAQRQILSEIRVQTENGHEPTLGQLAIKTGIPKTTVHGVLKALRGRGLVEPATPDGNAWIAVL